VPNFLEITVGSYRNKHVVVLGSGITGLAAAEKLAHWSIDVSVIEKSTHIGGHAVQYACKATQTCVKCGACLVQQQLQRTLQNPAVDFYTGTEVCRVTREGPFGVELEKRPSGQKQPIKLQADAILLATGFQPFNPLDKPFGYGRFANVVTNLELERLLREPSELSRPSDNRPVQRVAFIQCVGSRDTSLGHRWCSQVCCGSALRMAQLIQYRRPQTEVGFFYIDVQSVGKDFQAFTQQCRQTIKMVRAIPGEILATPEQDLKMVYFDPQSRKPEERIFDMVVLSIGMLPAADNRGLSEILRIELTADGFFEGGDSSRGVFSAGTANGPMSIAECIGSAGRAAWKILNHLDAFKTQENRDKKWSIEPTSSF
jgi:heterodisulfide reductase subunit A